MASESPLWTFNLREVSPDTLAATLTAGNGAMTHGEVLQGWSVDEAFSAFWSDALAAMPFEAFCWEMPPLTADRLAAPFECAVIDSPMLGLMFENAKPYAEYFAASGDAQVVAFPNLSGDCVLVCPMPAADDDTEHTHLASFLRSASPPHARALWEAVAEAVLARIGEPPVWVSTAGLGVGWLHVRVSSVPKYYRCLEYTK